MKGRTVMQSAANRRARKTTIAFFVASILVSTDLQYCFGQQDFNSVPRVMLGVRFSGDSALVSYVKPNGPAFRAGIEVGDEIFSVNDQFVLQSIDLVRNLAYNQPGDKVRVEVRRNGEYLFLTLDVIMATRDGQRIAADGTILPPPPEIGMVGEKAPDIKVSTWRNLPDNQMRCQLEDYLGKVVVLMLFQTTCEYSEEDAMPLLAELYQMHKDDPEVQFLSVLASFPQHEDNTLENAVAMCERFNLPIPIGKDTSLDLKNTVCKTLKGLGSPWFVMIDKQGFIALNGVPADIIDRNVVNRIKRGEKVMESIAQSEMMARPAPTNGDDDQ